MDRPTSRAQSTTGDGTATGIKRADTSSTVKNPSLRPAISTSTPSTRTPTLIDRLSKPTTASITKPTPSATASSLSKPPTRPTVSTVRKSTNTSTTTPSTTASVHSKRPSVDGKATDDESKVGTGATAAKPKRLSIAPSISSDRLATSRATAPTLARRISTATTTSTLRAGAASPAPSRSSVKSPTTTRSATNAVTKPTPTSILRQKSATTPVRNAPVAPDRTKRLSTIAGSPATGATSKKKKEDGRISESDSSPKSIRTALARPRLGTRKSTHSVLMEQQIREFELVNQMLQQAVALEGRGEAEQEALEDEAAETMHKLRTTLGKVRKFEKQHGRMPSETELTEISSVDFSDGEKAFDVNESIMSVTASVSGDDAHTLREELNESRAYSSQLELQIEDMTTKLKEFGESVEAEGDKVNDATDKITMEHTSNMRDISSANQARLDHLRTIHREEINELSTQHQQEIEELRQSRETEAAQLRTNHETIISTKDDELQRLQEQVHDLARRSEEAASNRDTELVARDSEVQTLKEQIANADKQRNDLIANHEMKLDLMQAEVTTLAAKSKNTEALNFEIKTLQSELNEAKDRKPDTSESDAEIANLKVKLNEARNVKPDTTKLDAEIATLRSELDEVRAKIPDFLAKDTEIAKLSADLEAARNTISDTSGKDAEIAKLRSHIESLSSKAEPEHTGSASRAVSPVKQDATVVELQTKLSAIEKRHAAAKENAKSKSAKQAEEHAVQLAAATKNNETALQNSKNELEQLENDLRGKQTELESLKTSHDEALYTLKQQLDIDAQEIEKLQRTIKDSEGKQTELNISTNTIEGLRKEIQDLQLEREEHEKSASDALNAVRADHVEQLQNSEKQLREVQSDLEQLRYSNDKTVSDRIVKLQDELTVIQGDLNNAQTSHSEALKELQAKLDQANKQAESAQAERNVELQELQKEAADASQAYENTKTDLEIQLETAKKQLSEIEVAMETTKTSHTNEMAEVTAKLNDTREKDIASLKASHAKRLKQLEEEGRASIAGLEELEKAHDAKIVELQNVSDAEKEAALTEQSGSHFKALHELKAQIIELQDASSTEKEVALKEQSEEHAKALDELNTKIVNIEEEAAVARDAALKEQGEIHTKALEELHIKHATAREELELLKAQHTTELEDMSITHASDKDTTLKALQEEHAIRLSEIASQPKGMDDAAVDALKESYAEQIRQLETQNQGLTSQIEGTRFQLQTIKGIFADQERQNEEKEKEHEKELQFEKDQFSQAILRISKHGAQLAQKDAEQTEALNVVRTEMQDAHGKAIEDLREEHSSALEELTDRLQTEHNALRKSLSEEHAKAMQVLTQGSTAKDADIEKLRLDHAEALNHARETTEISHKDVLDALRNEHSSKLSTLATELDETHTSALESAGADHEAAIAKQKTEFEADLATLKSDHASAFAALRSEMETIRSTAKSAAAHDASKTESANTSLAETRLALHDVCKDHDEILKRVNATHEEAIGRLQIELADLKAEADQAQIAAAAQARHLEGAQSETSIRDMTIEDNLKAEIAQAEARIEALTEEHQRSWSEAKSQHAKALKVVREELNEVQQQIADQPDRSLELEDLKKKVENATTLSNAVVELEKRNEELNQKYTFAADEAEKHAKRVQDLETEIKAMPKSGKAAGVDTVSSPALSTVGKGRSAPNSNVPSPRVSSGGLQSSKWAAAEPDSKLNAKAQTFAPASSALGIGLGVEIANNDDEYSDGGRSKTGRSERNVHGQLAGINEDIRSLNDLSERMLAENRRMAKTLSRVDDDTGNIDTVTVDEDQ